MYLCFAHPGDNTFGCESLLLPEPPSFESTSITPSQAIFTIRILPETGKAK